MNIQKRLEEIEREFENNYSTYDLNSTILYQGKIYKAKDFVKSFYTSKIKYLLKDYLEWAEGQKKYADKRNVTYYENYRYNQGIKDVMLPLKKLENKINICTTHL